MSAKPADLPLGKKLAYSAILVTAGLLLLEGIARVFVQPRDAPTREEHERLISVLGLPALNETMEFDPELFWRLKRELRAFHVAGKVREHTIDFRVTTHAGLRSPAISRTKKGLRILALGDSLTFGLGVADDETWPAQLEGLLRAGGIDAELVNAGVPGYSSFQGKRFLETRGLGLDPDLVLVSFGFNDADRGMASSDAETARMLALGRWEETMVRSRFVYGMKLLLQRATAPRPTAEPVGGRTDGRPRLTEQEFYATLGEIGSLCAARNIGMLVVIWPYQAQVTQRAPDYLKYQVPAARFCQEQGVDGVNLITAFLRANGPLFVDHIHGNPAGCRVAAEAIAPWVAAWVARNRGPERRPPS